MAALPALTLTQTLKEHTETCNMALQLPPSLSSTTGRLHLDCEAAGKTSDVIPLEPAATLTTVVRTGDTLGGACTVARARQRETDMAAEAAARASYAAKRETILFRRANEARWASAALFGRETRWRTLTFAGSRVVSTRTLFVAPKEALVDPDAVAAMAERALKLPEANVEHCLEVLVFDEPRGTREACATDHWRLLKSRDSGAGGRAARYILGRVAHHNGREGPERAESAAATRRRDGVAGPHETGFLPSDAAAASVDATADTSSRRPASTLSVARSGSAEGRAGTCGLPTSTTDPAKHDGVIVSSRHTSELPGRGIQGVSAPLVDWTIVTDAHVCVEGGEGKSQFVVLTSTRPQACKVAEAGSVSALPSAAWQPTSYFYGWKLRRVWVLAATSELAPHDGSTAGASPRRLPPTSVRRLLSLKPGLPGHTAIDSFAFLANEAPGAEPADVWYSSVEAAALVTAVRSTATTAAELLTHANEYDASGQWGEAGTAAVTPRMLVTSSSSGVSKQGWSPAFRVYAFGAPLPGTQRVLISRRRLRAAAANSAAASGRNRTREAEFTVSRDPLGADWRTVSAIFVMP